MIKFDKKLTIFDKKFFVFYWVGKNCLTPLFRRSKKCSIKISLFEIGALFRGKIKFFAILQVSTAWWQMSLRVDFCKIAKNFILPYSKDFEINKILFFPVRKLFSLFYYHILGLIMLIDNF